MPSPSNKGAYVDAFVHEVRADIERKIKQDLAELGPNVPEVDVATAIKELRNIETLSSGRSYHENVLKALRALGVRA